MALDKLVDSTQLDADLTSVADAIREKGGTSASLAFPADFVQAIEDIETGGGGDYVANDWLVKNKPVGAVTGDAASYGNYRISGRTGITSLSLPNATSIGNSFCNGCTGLVSVTLPNATSFGTDSFVGCSSLETLIAPKVTSPNGISGTKITSLSFPVGAVSGINQNSLLTTVVTRSINPNYNSNLGSNVALTTVDLISRGTGAATAPAINLRSGCFTGDSALTTLIIRSTTLANLVNVSAFNGTPFRSGGTGGTIYIPKSLYDQLGTGTNDYNAASNWSTVYGYGTITWAQIEGSYYETHYADGTEIT